MDIFSKIVLSAQGGDAAAREIAKIKKAYEETAKAAEQIRKAGGKVTPEQVGGAALQSLGMGREIREFFEGREQKNAQERDRAERRENDNRTRTGHGPRQQPGKIIESTGQLAEQGSGALAGTQSDSARFFAAGSSRAGEYLKEKARDYQQRRQQRDQDKAAAPTGSGGTESSDESSRSEVGHGLSGVGKTLPFAGAVLAGGGAILRIISNLAHQEYSRAQQIFGSGMGQRAGMDYDTMRSQRIMMGRHGVSFGAMDSYYNALGLSGGNGMNAMTQTAMATGSFYGIDGSTMGRMMGLRQQAGLGRGVPDYMLGPAQMPQGLMGRYISMISSAVEQGMQRGLTAGSGLESISKGTSVMMDSLMKAGQTYTGAESTTQAIQSHYMTGGSMISSPQQAMQFMRYRRSGESYFDTMKRIQNPAEMAKLELENARRVTGGDHTRMMWEMAGRLPELAPGQLDSYVSAAGDIISGAGPLARRQVKSSLTELAGVRGADVMATMQQSMFEGLEAKSVTAMGVLNGTTKMVLDAVVDLKNVVSSAASKLTTVVSTAR